MISISTEAIRTSDIQIRSLQGVRYSCKGTEPNGRWVGCTLRCRKQRTRYDRHPFEVRGEEFDEYADLSGA